ncbi:MAG: tRNA 2-thiouridine(34) synthase MnmA [Spirochaetes bacterium]|nr:tRNA 2-thiouridine(34) synthase MnmA [Spirochaetota bacterium]
MGQRVAVGMSGGVDSSVAALLLKEAGHEVIGVTMSIYPGGQAERGRVADGPAAGPVPDSCYGPGEAADIEDAARVCARLGIPHHVVDLRDDYRKLVIEYTRAEYLAGRTPNPCVRCNRLVKFGLLFERLAEAVGGVDAFATGHYVRVSFDRGTGRWAVRKAADASKDQSYFLCLLGQEQLARAIFPLGELTKPEVRRRAREAGMEIHDRAESQDFAAGGYRSLVEASGREGLITDSRGEVIGSHQGTWGYTIGQRRGLGVGGGEPLYVTRIDAASNTVVAGPEAELWRRELTAVGVNWMGVAGAEAAMRLSVKIRYRSPEAPALVAPLAGDRVRVTFDEPQRAIAPGQWAVCYDGERIALAGVIE